MFGTATWNLVAAAGTALCTLLAWRRRFAAATLVVSCLLAAHVLHRDIVVDDTYIALRYARNLVEGHGPVFNPGERVEGFTSPLWLAFLAAAMRAGVDPLAAARVAGVACALAVLLRVAGWSRRLLRGSRVAIAAPLLLALNPSFALWAAAGLEAPLFALLVVEATAACVAGRTARAAMLACASVLVRPEAILLPGFLAAGLAGGRRRRRALALVVPAVAVALALALVRHAYYDAWLPNTYHAKVTWSLQSLRQGAEYVLRFAVLHGGLVVWVLPLAAWIRRRQAAPVGIVAAGFTVAAMLVGGDGLPGFRFLMPAVPLFALLVPLGAVAVAPLGRLPAGLAAALAFALAMQTANAYTAWERDRRVMRDFVLVARWLGPLLGPEDSIAVSAAGAIGYHTRARVVDRLGLTDAGVARLPARGSAAGHAKFDADSVLRRRPTIVTVDWNGLYAEPPPALDAPALLAFLEARFDGERLLAAPELWRDYEPRCVRVRDSGYFIFFVRSDQTIASLVGGAS